MGKSLSRLVVTVRACTPEIPKDLKEQLKLFIPGMRYKNLVSHQSSEITLLNRKIEELDRHVSKKNEDFDQLFSELQRERDWKETQVQQSSEKEVHFLTENQMLQDKNSKLLEQIYNLFEKERMKTKDEHSFQMAMSDSQNKVLSQIEKLNEQISKPKSPSKIGDIGEEYVLQCLQQAFPNNTSIVRSKEINSGDIFFRIENTDKYIMFEVKNNARSIISGVNNGKDIAKFFHDLHSPSSSIPIHGGVLISLNSPVDLNYPPLVPMFYQGKPYIYIDSMKLQYPDPECLMKVVVHMMTYLIKNCDQLEVESFGSKIENYQQNMIVLMKTYQKLYKNHEAQKRNLEFLKSSLDGLRKVFQDDLKEAANHDLNGKESFEEELP
eukprot:GFUD01023007.1.p1 GENE.GFUD01023007.1~~GFUD01023007.1.p1  ORF type:complete len:381 (-),score=98.08 GFUD01023007.1:14-1156(-)